MKFGELLKEYSWDDVALALLRVYPDEDKNIEGYKHVFDTLQTLSPTKTNMRIVIENALDPSTKEYYPDVSGKNGTLVKEDSPYTEDDTTGNQEQTYGIEFQEWSEWLGMELDPSTLEKFSEEEIIAHCLWEMTFFGYTQEEIQKTFDEIKEARDNIDFDSFSDIDDLYNDE